MPSLKALGFAACSLLLASSSVMAQKDGFVMEKRNEEAAHSASMSSHGAAQATFASIVAAAAASVVPGSHPANIDNAQKHNIMSSLLGGGGLFGGGGPLTGIPVVGMLTNGGMMGLGGKNYKPDVWGAVPGFPAQVHYNGGNIAIPNK
ncbi:hypothetical protein RQP46_003826 [Phenoliferia psychrophenolica]